MEVTPISASVTLGGTIQLTAQVLDSGRLVWDFPITWSSSDGSIVSVDAAGLVTGRSLGQTSVRAAVGSIFSNAVSVTVQDVRVINLETNDLIYDSSRQRIYASVPSGAGENPDRILVINPETGTVTRTIFVGDDPGKLAISDDFRYLYVAVNGAAISVRRINLSNNQVDLSFPIGTSIVSGQLRVDDMEVVPGSPQSLVVARMNIGSSPRYAGVAIFDNGVQRPEVSPFGESNNQLEFGATPSRLYGADRESSGNNMSIMNIGPSGVTLVGVGCCSFDGQFNTGFIYSSNGQVINPELKQIVGVLPGTSPLNYRNDDLLKIDPTRNRIYLIKAIDAGMRLLAFDRTSLRQIGSADLFPPFMALGSPVTSLTLWGSEGLAFRDGMNKTLVLLRTSILQ